jgi:hypothetical protein
VEGVAKLFESELHTVFPKSGLLDQGK